MTQNLLRNAEDHGRKQPNVFQDMNRQIKRKASGSLPKILAFRVPH